MKHDLIFDGPTPLLQDHGTWGNALPLSLHFIESVSATGELKLAGCDGWTILCPQRYASDVAGHFAVCIGTGAEKPAVMVLGYLPIDAVALALGRAQGDQERIGGQPRPVTLKCGRSQLQLHPDGRIRILGDDIIVESHGRTALRGAVIDLN